MIYNMEANITLTACAISFGKPVKEIFAVTNCDRIVKRE